MLDDARWWTIRRAQNRKPATYRPLCGRHLHAMTDHVLIAPAGDTRRRRHGHSECVRAAREAGGLPSYDEWRNTQLPTRWRSRLFGKRRKRPSECVGFLHGTAQFFL